MTRGKTGEAYRRAQVLCALENLPYFRELLNTPFPQCVVTTSKESSDTASCAGQSGRPIAARCRPKRTASRRSETFNKMRCSQAFFEVRDGEGSDPAPPGGTCNLFLCLTLGVLSDNHPALLIMFDRTQAANNLTKAVPHQ